MRELYGPWERNQICRGSLINLKKVSVPAIFSLKQLKTTKQLRSSFRRTFGFHIGIFLSRLIIESFGRRRAWNWFVYSWFVSALTFEGRGHSSRNNAIIAGPSGSLSLTRSMRASSIFIHFLSLLASSWSSVITAGGSSSLLECSQMKLRLIDFSLD